MSAIGALGGATAFVELITHAIHRRVAFERRCPGRCEPTVKTSLHVALLVTGNCVWTDRALQPAPLEPCVFMAHMFCPKASASAPARITAEPLIN